MMSLKDATPYRLALERRRELNEHRTLPDNGSLPAGSPMFFRCPICFGDIILPEGYLTKPYCCYDCQDLRGRRLIVGPQGKWRGPVSKKAKKVDDV